jgi:serine protease Do
LIVTTLLAFAFAPFTTLCAAPADSAGLATLDFREVVRKAKDRVFPAVVFIKVVQATHDLGKKQSREIAGSGVLVSENGELLTNWHVMEKAVETRCLLFDGRAFEAEVVGTDKDLDLALVRLKSDKKLSGLPHAELGESDRLAEGDFVMAMGAPWGMARSVSIGIISCTRRFLIENSEYSLWLQTDASISPGNSGGPLVNTAGEVVGINTMGVIFGGDMGFAVPSATIREILPRLRQRGDIEWAWIGLQLQPIRDFDRNVYFEGNEGVIVSGTDEASPARAAGVQERDRLLAVNDVKVTALTAEELPAVRRMMALLPLEKPIKLTLQRGNKTLNLSVTPRRKGKVEGEELDCPRWDLTVKAINQFENRDLYFYRQQGVFLFGIEVPGNAADVRLGRGDIILEIGGQEVKTLDDVRRIYRESVANVAAQSRLLFTVLRNGLMRQVILDFSRDYERE